VFNFTSDSYFTTYLSAHLFVILVLFTIILLAMRTKSSEARHTFLFFAGAAFVMMAGYYFELSTSLKEVYIIALKIQYFAAGFLLVAAIKLVSVFCMYPVPRRILITQSIISAITMLLAMTMEYNSFLFTDLLPQWNGHYHRLIIAGGIYYPIHCFDCVLVFFYCLYVCIRSLRKSKGRDKKRIIWLIVSMGMLTLMIIVRSFTIRHGYEVISFFVLASTICLFVSLVRYQFFNSRQIAIESVFNHNHDGIIVASADGNITFFNHQAELMLPESVRGNINHDALLQMVLDERHSQVTINNNVYDIHAEDIVENNVLLGYEFVVTDLTELFSYMDQLREKTEEADRANAAKLNFLANMSHEIRTPLNAILGMNEMILRESKNGSVQKYALDIQSAGKTLLSIVNDILDISKIESGKAQLVNAEYSLSSVLNDIVNMTMRKAASKGLKYEINVSPDIPTRLYGDEIRIRQIMLNVINNAVKYTAKGSVTVNVGFTAKSETTIELAVRVEDTGIGICKEDLGKLFQTFQRLDETKNRKIEGTGLGLIITKQYAEMMNGRVEVSSEPGVGSVFTIYFDQRVLDPRPLGDFTQALHRAQAEHEVYVPKLCAPDAKVLIVDDNEMNLQVITGLLGDTRIMLNVATSGEQCIEMVRKKHYDLILLDQMMPGLDGTQTLHYMRDHGLIDGVPVIVLTADAVVGAREAYLASGFNDYLSKPVMYAELENALITHLPEKLLTPPQPIEASAQPAEAKRSVLVVDASPEKLKECKAELETHYSGTYVRSMEKARQYLEKHAVDYIILPASEESFSALGIDAAPPDSD